MAVNSLLDQSLHWDWLGCVRCVCFPCICALEKLGPNGMLRGVLLHRGTLKQKNTAQELCSSWEKFVLLQTVFGSATLIPFPILEVCCNGLCTARLSVLMASKSTFCMAPDLAAGECGPSSCACLTCLLHHNVSHQKMFVGRQGHHIWKQRHSARVKQRSDRTTCCLHASVQTTRES
jgi:hypothetical protein